MKIPEGARSATKPGQTGGMPGCTLAPPAGECEGEQEGGFLMNRCARCAGPLGLAVNGICPACRQGVRRVPAEAMLRETEKAHARHEGISPALDRLTEGRIRMLKARMKDAPPRPVAAAGR